MDKVKLAFESPKNKTVEYNGVIITIKPFISIHEQVILIQYYIDEYFNIMEKKDLLINGSGYNYIGAEYNLIHSIFQLLTNVDIESADTDMYDSSELWKDVKSKISNYDEFRHKLDKIVSDIKEERFNKTTTGAVIENLSSKLLTILEEFSKLSPADIEKVKNSGLELLKEIEKQPIKGVVETAKQEIKRKRKKV